MKKNIARRPAFRVGILSALATFLLLSVFMNSVVEISRDLGTLRWMGETVLYVLMNKLLYKAFTSLLVGLVAGFASNMITYGKSVKERSRKGAAVQFRPAANTQITSKSA